jgi:hypothetical protein
MWQALPPVIQAAISVRGLNEQRRQFEGVEPIVVARPRRHGSVWASLRT